MADKQVPLSIIIRTVDRATAGINAVNKRLDAIARPARDFGKALSDLGEKSGFNAVVDGVKGVGSAIEGLALKALAIGVAVGEAVHLVLELVESFAQLGHTAARAGVETDFLAGMRYAAAKTGIGIEQLDQGLVTLTQNMGQAKAGTGRMLKFLNEVSPALARQVVAAHGTDEAIGLLADAMQRIPDAARRAALAQKTLGDSAFAPLLAKGSKGIQALMATYARLAGPQGDAAKGALAVEDALVDLRAGTEGVKAALVTGLAPAMQKVIERMTDWLVGHREDIARWAASIGEKLPAAVDKIVDKVKVAVDWGAKFVDRIGGWKNVAIAGAAVIAGPLVSAFATLTAAMLTTPFGLVATGIALITAEVLSLQKALGASGGPRSQKSVQLESTLRSKGGLPADFSVKDTPVEQRLRESGALPRSVRSNKWSGIDEIVQGPPGGLPMAPPRALPPSLEAALSAFYAAPAAAPAPAPPPARLKVEFVGTPNGARVTVDDQGSGIDLSVGHQLGFQ